MFVLKFYRKLLMLSNKCYTFLYLYIPYPIKYIFSYFNPKLNFENYNISSGLNISSIEKITYRTRRYIHMIEKGITSKNRRTVFALNYLNYLVYNLCTYKNNFSDLDIAWFKNVMEVYFDITEKNNPIISDCRALYYSVYSKSKVTKYYSNRSSIITKSNIQMESYYALFMKRRSIRYYLPLKVDKKLIMKCLNLAFNSPSACNRLPYRYIVLQTKSIIDTYLKLSPGASSFANQVHNVIVAIGDYSAFDLEKDNKTIYIDTSLSIMALVNAFHAANLGSCCINWPSTYTNDQKSRSILNLRSHERVILTISFGYKDLDQTVPSSYKKSLINSVSYV